jgi:hypothetical protein
MMTYTLQAGDMEKLAGRDNITILDEGAAANAEFSSDIAGLESELIVGNEVFI